MFCSDKPRYYFNLHFSKKNAPFGERREEREAIPQQRSSQRVSAGSPAFPSAAAVRARCRPRRRRGCAVRPTPFPQRTAQRVLSSEPRTRVKICPTLCGGGGAGTAGGGAGALRALPDARFPAPVLTTDFFILLKSVKILLVAVLVTCGRPEGSHAKPNVRCP